MSDKNEAKVTDQDSNGRSAKFRDRVLTNLQTKIEHLLGQRHLCDVTVAIGDVTFECHGVVLAAASDFFQASLTSSWCESSSRVIRIDHSDVTAGSFRLLLDILYKCEDVINMSTAKDILRMAVFLQIKFLQEDIEEYLADNMGPDTCLGIWQMAEKYELPQLAETAVKMASAQFEKMSKCAEFLKLPRVLLLILLSSDPNISADNLFLSVMLWVEVDLRTRGKHLAELLPFISFTELSPGFLGRQVLPYLDHTLKDALSEYINEALRYNLCGKLENDERVQKQILARQHKRIKIPNMSEQVVLFGGVTRDDQPIAGVSAIPAFNEGCSNLKRLQPPPGSFGTESGTCLWRNEVYVSGGSAQSSLFAVYKTGDGDWELLPEMPRGRQNHAMVAFDWKIYFIGGKDNSYCAEDPELIDDVAAYNIKTRSWSVVAKLVTAVDRVAAAVLGHRIYVFGSRVVGRIHCELEWTSIVQCVDTLTGCVYTAGRLQGLVPVQALCDGGTVYVATSDGHVLRMKENYILADERERLLELASCGTTDTNNVETEEVVATADAAKVLSKTEQRVPTPPFMAAPDDTAKELSKTTGSDGTGDGSSDANAVKKLRVSLDSADEVAANPEAAEVCPENDSAPSVSFCKVGEFPSRQNFGAYLYDGELVVCGGRSVYFFEDLCDDLCDELCYDQIGIDLRTGKLTHKLQTLTYDRKQFGVHVLNMPDERLSENEAVKQGAIRFCFSPAMLLKLKDLESSEATIGGSVWTILVQYNKPPFIGVFLTWVCDTRGSKTVTVGCTMTILPSANGVRSISRQLDHTFTKSEGIGFTEFTTLDKLTDTNGAYLHDGKVMVECYIVPRYSP